MKGPGESIRRFIPAAAIVAVSAFGMSADADEKDAECIEEYACIEPPKKVTPPPETPHGLSLEEIAKQIDCSVIRTHATKDGIQELSDFQFLEVLKCNEIEKVEFSYQDSSEMKLIIFLKNGDTINQEVLLSFGNDLHRYLLGRGINIGKTKDSFTEVTKKTWLLLIAMLLMGIGIGINLKPITETKGEKIPPSNQTESAIQLTPAARERAAIHEAGHTVMYLLNSNPVTTVQRVSIDSNPPGIVFTSSQGYILTKTDLEWSIKLRLAGGIAEMMEMKEGSIMGSVNDLKEATDIATRMVMEYGMLSNNDNPSSRFRFRDVKDQLPQGDLDDYIDRILDDCGKEAEKALIQNRELLIAIAKRLMEIGTIEHDELLDFSKELGKPQKQTNIVRFPQKDPKKS